MSSTKLSVVSETGRLLTCEVEYGPELGWMHQKRKEDGLIEQ